MATKIWVNIDWGEGLLPEDSKPLPKLTITYRDYSAKGDSTENSVKDDVAMLMFQC